MKIQIAGPGCGRCQATEKIVHEVCNELNLQADIEHVYDIQEYAKLGVRLTPAVLVDGENVFSGRVPTNDELKKIISEIS
ncbi:MAG: thioredoxin family protein [Desulfobulbaceae bacterium]|nr:thioredoxin family protein [Desulfobulbaceae bacterium]